jgi:hypothetical protein
MNHKSSKSLKKKLYYPKFNPEINSLIELFTDYYNYKIHTRNDVSDTVITNDTIVIILEEYDGPLNKLKFNINDITYTISKINNNLLITPSIEKNKDESIKKIKITSNLINDTNCY